VKKYFYRKIFSKITRTLIERKKQQFALLREFIAADDKISTDFRYMCSLNKKFSLLVIYKMNFPKQYSSRQKYMFDIYFLIHVDNRA
jgi:hypothetical protein